MQIDKESPHHMWLNGLMFFLFNVVYSKHFCHCVDFKNVPWCPIESNRWVGHLLLVSWHPWNMSHLLHLQAMKDPFKTTIFREVWVESKIRYSVSACISHMAKLKSTATLSCSGVISPTAVLTTISCQCRTLSWRVPWQKGDSLLAQRRQKHQTNSNFGRFLLKRSL